MADVNGDGKQDIIVGRGAGGWVPDHHNHVNVFLGNGDVFFQASRTSTTLNQGSEYAVAADFNGDGKIDPSPTITDPKPTPPPRRCPDPTGQWRRLLQAASYRGQVRVSRHVAVGALNRDGRPDFVLANHDSADVSAFRNGDGTFRADLSYPTGGQIELVVVVDFNRDGFDDIGSGCRVRSRCCSTGRLDRRSSQLHSEQRFLINPAGAFLTFTVTARTVTARRSPTPARSTSPAPTRRRCFPLTTVLP